MNSYAIYRLPYADETVRVEGEIIHDISLLSSLPRGRKYFVMASFAATPSEVKRSWSEAFDVFKSALDEGLFKKLVLSRCVKLDMKVDAEAAFDEACKRYPRMMIYLCSSPETGTWLGCTPEIILVGSKSHYRTVALAGTMPYAEHVEWSEKNRLEQAIVADYIRNILRKYADVIEEEGPYTSRAGQLVHLKTEFHFQPRTNCSVVDVIDELHPTPAVCGVPKDEAKRFILENEGYDRKYYSGIVGVFDPQGETNLFVNLRCAEISSDEVVLYAGGGILKDSDKESEWNETEEKMKTVGGVLSYEL